jgi:two-component system chemotaxis response regulator CheY
MMSNDSLSILIIEDNNMFIKLACSLLKGHVIHQANDGETGIDLFTSETPDITFLDINLPDLNGLEVLKKLKEENSKSYIVMMTASNIVDDITESKKLGANGYLKKPFSAARLNEYIGEYRKYAADNS